MKALIRKDLYEMKTFILILLLFVFVISFVLYVDKFSTNPEENPVTTILLLSYFSVSLGMIFSMVFIKSDESSNFNKLALTMPISRKDFVIGKYIMSSIIDIIAGLAVLSVSGIGIAFKLWKFNDISQYITGTLALLLLLQSFILFLSFLFDGKKAGIICCVFIMAISMLASVGLPFISEYVDITTLFEKIQVIYLFLVGIGIFVISCIISIFAYKKHDF